MAGRLVSLPTLLLGIAGAGIFSFFVIADEVSEQDIYPLDRRLFLMMRNPADPSDPIGPPWLEEAAVELTALGGVTLIALTVMAVAGFLLAARRIGPALYLIASVGTGTMLSQGLKSLYDRPRPDIAPHLDVIHTASFPSGHALVTTVCYLTLGAIIVGMVESRRVRAYVMIVAIAVSVLVGLSRIYLGVHWPSDVAAGWALGTAWAVLSLLALKALRRRRHWRGIAVGANGGDAATPS
jgi:undecaprenyl-diphosphatase